jgi:predicted GNAT family acetyltransferase
MIQIRCSNEYDAEAIVGFQLKMAKETEGVSLDEIAVNNGVNAVFNDPHKGTYYVATDDDKIIASLLLTPEWSDWRNSWVMWIQSVYVVPESRGKGVFKSMYKYITNMAKESSKIAGVRLYVDLSNSSARNVYAKLGMVGDHYQLFEWMK